MSLDGFVAGANQSVKEPLGVGGEQLHEWVTSLATWRRAHGMEGGDVNESTRVLEQEIANIGATIMGRNMFGGHPGAWSATDPWKGWWGRNPPFHHPVFVLTHHAREPLVTEGGTTFTFVTDGIESALEQARRAAGEKDIALSGGAQAAQQYLNAGLVDEMQLHMSPMLLGAGERLFDGVSDLHGLALVETVAAPNVVHLKFART
jgi:dihydrofolate reductase